MSWFSEAPAPVKPPIAVDAVTTLVRSSTLVGQYFLAQPEDVYKNFRDIGSDVPDRWAVVRALNNIGDTMAGVSKTRSVLVQVMIAIEQTRPNKYQWLYAAHERVFEALQNQKPALTEGRLVLPIRQHYVASTPMMMEDEPFLANSATYSLVIDPS